MSLRLPDLDDRTYSDLVKEAQALIPALYPEWTDHNATDPGITLIELFAWLTEMLIYRVDRLPREHVRTFLQLLNGPAWEAGPDLDEDIRATVTDLRRRHRAVTAEDYKLLASEASDAVVRVRCVPLRNLSAATEAERKTPRPGLLSVIIVPDPEQAGAKDPASQPRAPLPSADLLAAVTAALEPRRLLTVRHFVVAPIYAPVQGAIVVAPRPDVPGSLLQQRIREALVGFLDPLTGGPDGEGWPFGRDVYVSEIYQILEAIPGVDYVSDVTLSSTCPPGAPRCVAAEELWHEDGNLIGLGLGAHHLPWPQIDLTDIVVGAVFLPVRVLIEIERNPEVPAELARRQILELIRRKLHPLSGGPNGQGVWKIFPRDLRPGLLDLPAVDAILNLEVGGPDERMIIEKGEKGVQFLVGELANLETVDFRGMA